MNQPNIGFIGAGNMATSLIGGMVKKGFEKSTFIACDPSAEQLDRLKTALGNPDNLSTSQENAAIVESDVIILAVKPQIMPSVASSLREHIKPGALVISIAAGITIESLEKWLGDIAIVRCMPNTPALIQQGATGLFANMHLSDEQKTLSLNILSAVGIAHWVEKEDLIDVVTAISGSGPAYFFLFAELMAEAAKDMGLDDGLAEKLSLQTFLGAGLLATQSQDDLSTLRNKVTSPGGTTAAAIASFESADLRATIKNAMKDAADRAKTMSEEFGG